MVAEKQPRSIADRIRAEIDFDPKASDEKIADRIILDVTKDDLFPLLLNEVSRLRREESRSIERRVIPRLLDYFTPPRRPSDRPTVEQRRIMLVKLRPDLNALRKRRLDLGDGTSVLWGKLSIDQARLRYAMLSRQRVGIDTTMTQLSEVIGLLETSGVSCLDELVRLA